MPTFPTYDGPPIPVQLNPLSPRHWLMVLNWVFFYPSRLKHYLYRADADLYRMDGVSSLRRGLQTPSYRSLLVISLLMIVLIPFLFWVGMALAGFEVRWGGVAGGVAVGVAVGVAFGVAFGVAGGVAFGVAFGVALGVASGVANGVAGGVAGGVAFGVALGVASGVAGGVVVGAVGGVMVGLRFGMADGVAGGVAAIVGTLQLLSSLLEAIRVLQSAPFAHEIIVLPPLPGILRQHRRLLATQPHQAIAILRNFFLNSLRAHSAIRLCNQTLKEHPNSLTLFYAWLQLPQVNEYVAVPLGRQQFRQIPTLRRVLLGGLSNIFVDASGADLETSERVAWRVARRLYRSNADHKLIPLSALLLDLDLLDGLTEKAEPLQTALDKVATLDAIRELPCGNEVVTSFELLKEAFACQSVAAIAQLQLALAASKVEFPTPLRPQVIELLAALADVAQEIVNYTEFSNPGAQGAALNRALSMLNELHPQAQAINLPEHTLIEAVIECWQDVIAKEAGRVGHRALREARVDVRLAAATVSATGELRISTLWRRPSTPFANPYITGRPVIGSNFIGRQDTLTQIVERWHNRHTPDSIILYGHRRMGKTSIVQSLAVNALPGLLVYLDLAGATATAEQPGDLLFDIADKIHTAAIARFPDLPQPQFEEYQQAKSADIHFQRLLRAVIERLPEGAFLVLAFDEFEALEKTVEVGTLDKSVYGYLRTLSQQPRITLILAGLHTLDEMSRDYQQAFFSSFHNVRVSYLARHEAEKLIASPNQDFTLNYERSVIDEIYRLTYGQPLLIQSICSALVNHLNHELFDLELEREARILPTDLESVLTDDFLRREVRYFEGIWQDQLAEYPDQQALLYILASQTAPLTTESLIASSKLTSEQVKTALQSLAKRDVIVEENETWRLLMPLFQRWLQLQMKERKES